MAFHAQKRLAEWIRWSRSSQTSCALTASWLQPLQKTFGVKPPLACWLSACGSSESSCFPAACQYFECLHCSVWPTDELTCRTFHRAKGCIFVVLADILPIIAVHIRLPWTAKMQISSFWRRKRWRRSCTMLQLRLGQMLKSVGNVVWQRPCVRWPRAGSAWNVTSFTCWNMPTSCGKTGVEHKLHLGEAVTLKWFETIVFLFFQI